MGVAGTSSGLLSNRLFCCFPTALQSICPHVPSLWFSHQCSLTVTPLLVLPVVCFSAPHLVVFVLCQQQAAVAVTGGDLGKTNAQTIRADPRHSSVCRDNSLGRSLPL